MTMYPDGGPDPFEKPDEVDGSTNPLAEYAEGAYLSAAAKWLVSAEKDLRNATVGEAFPYPESADLADLNIRMAAACGAYQDRQLRVQQATSWLTVGDTEAMGAKIAEQMKADDEAHQAVRLRPGTDPEPEGSEGDLWTFAEPDDAAGTWFWYAVSANPWDPSRWLMVQHYGEFLRWRDERGTKPNPHTWGEIAEDTDGEAVLRRPTAAERAVFYGPAPESEDNAPTPPEHVCGAFRYGLGAHASGVTMDTLCERCGASAKAHVDRGLKHLAAVGAGGPYPRWPQVGPLNDLAPSVLTHVTCPKCGFTGRALEPGERDRRTPENDPRCPGCAHGHRNVRGCVDRLSEEATAVAEDNAARSSGEDPRDRINGPGESALAKAAKRARGAGWRQVADWLAACVGANREGAHWPPLIAAPEEPDEMYSEGAARALERCSKVAEAAGKTRTAQWLYTCAAAARQGIIDWPEAPAYKGAVIHVDNPGPDLARIDTTKLDEVRQAVKREVTRRAYTAPEVRGGAAQWREG